MNQAVPTMNHPRQKQIDIDGQRVFHYTWRAAEKIVRIVVGSLHVPKSAVQFVLENIRRLCIVDTEPLSHFLKQNIAQDEECCLTPRNQNTAKTYFRNLPAKCSETLLLLYLTSTSGEQHN